MIPGDVDTALLIFAPNEAVVILNVLGFYDPLQSLIQSGIKEGFIPKHNEKMVVFVHGPADRQEHDIYNWGKAAIDALDAWDASHVECLPFDWQKEKGAEAL